MPLRANRLPAERQQEAFIGHSSELSESEEEEASFSQSSSSRARSSSSGKRRKKKKTKRRQQEDDGEPPRPLSDSIHQSKVLQRRENTMAKTAHKKRASKPTNQEGDDSDQEAKVLREENAKLKLELFRQKKRAQIASRSGPSAHVAAGSQTAMDREVERQTKTRLFHLTAFFRNDEKAMKGTKFVMESLDLVEMEGLEGKDLTDAQEEWKGRHKGTVSKSLNRQRNYVQQELRELMEEVFKENKEADYPDHEEIMCIIMREKLDSDTPRDEVKLYEKKFDNYWNALIPKVAGHKNWGPSKRHYELMSFGLCTDEGVANGDGLVTCSDEAFLAVLWENCFKKWRYKAQCASQGKKPDDKHDDMKTPCTDSKGGQKKCGGWNKEGIKRHSELKDMIQKNRINERTYIEEVEKQALERIRKEEKVAEKEANRKSKKRKPAPVVRDDDDSTDDENDYGRW